MTKMRFEGPTFTLYIPTDWMISATSQFQAIFTAPQADGGIKANFLIALRPVQDNVTVTGVAEAARQTQDKEYLGYEILSEVGIFDHDLEGLHRVYKWHNADRDLGVIQHQAFFILGNRLYSLTGTRAEEAKSTEEIDEAIESMIQSFSFKELDVDS